MCNGSNSAYTHFITYRAFPRVVVKIVNLPPTLKHIFNCVKDTLRWVVWCCAAPLPLGKVLTYFAMRDSFFIILGSCNNKLKKHLNDDNMYLSKEWLGIIIHCLNLHILLFVCIEYLVIFQPLEQKANLPDNWYQHWIVVLNF